MTPQHSLRNSREPQQIDAEPVTVALMANKQAVEHQAEPAVVGATHQSLEQRAEAHAPASSAMAPWRRALSRYAAIVRYHRPGQLVRRLVNRVSRPMFRAQRWDRCTGHCTLNQQTLAHWRSQLADYKQAFRARRDASWKSTASHRTSVALDEDALHHLAGFPSLDTRAHRHEAQFRLCFLGLTHTRLLPDLWQDDPTDIVWSADHQAMFVMPLLWRFHLHYHEFLEELVVDEPALMPLVLACLDDWITRYPASSAAKHDVAWHPYCLSRRLVVWCRLLALLDPSELEQPRPQTIITSLVNQAWFLHQHLERDLGGNHLWDNAKALCWVGALLSHPLPMGVRIANGSGNASRVGQRCWQTGRNILEQCIAEQVNRNGEHEERSPAYQLDLGFGLHDLAQWTARFDPAASTRFEVAARQLLAFIDPIRHLDGSIPLAGDSTFEAPASMCPLTVDEKPRADHEVTNKQSDGFRWHGDYAIVSLPGHQLVFDTGNMGPDHLPAHAHSDLLHIEMSCFGHPAIVDSGVFCYRGSARQEYRSSAMHNVLTINDVELGDVWGDFRMGRRGHVVRRLDLTSTTARRQNQVKVVLAEHDAYQHLGYRVIRLVALVTSKTGTADCLFTHVIVPTGKRKMSPTVSLAERVHFHPALSLAPVESTSQANPIAITSRRHDQVQYLHVPSHWSASIESSTWSPSFYVAEPNQRVTLRKNASLPSGSLGMVVTWALNQDERFSWRAAELVKPESARMPTLLLGWEDTLGDDHCLIEL